MAFAESTHEGQANVNAAGSRQSTGRWVVRALLVAAIVSLAGPLAGAVAGEFDVRSCQASASRNTSAWTTSVSTAYIVGPHHWCAAGDGGIFTGMDMRESLALHTRFDGPGAVAPMGRWGAVRLQAPPNGVLVRAQLRRRLKVYDDQWVPKFLADSSEVDACRPPASTYRCQEDDEPNSVADLTLPNASELTMALDCEDESCLADGSVGPWAMAALYSSIVTVREEVAPSASAPSAVGAVGGWLGPGGKIALAGSDTLGLRRLELLYGGAVVGTVQGSCVDWSTTPCAEASAGASTGLAGQVSVDGLAVPDGNVQLQVRAVDAAGNTATSAPASVQLDRGVPIADNLRVSGDADLRRVTWGYDGRAPLTAASARFCVGTTPADAVCRDQPLALEARSTQFEVAGGLYGSTEITLTNTFGRTATVKELAPLRTPPQPPKPPTGPGPGPSDPTPAPDPGPKTSTVTLALKRHTGRRLRLTGNATPGAATRVTIKLSAPRPGKSRWTRTLRLTPTKRTGRYATTITIPTTIRPRARITAVATTTPATGYKRATRTRTIRR